MGSVQSEQRSILHLTLLELENIDQKLRNAAPQDSSKTSMAISYTTQSAMLEPEFKVEMKPKFGTSTLKATNKPKKLPKTKKLQWEEDHDSK